MHTIFISRNLAQDSLLRGWARDRKVRIIAQSLLRFTAVPFAVPERADWWFFYSSRAVEFSVAALAALPVPPRLAALGEGTAKSLREAGYGADFTGKGQLAAVAADFGRVAHGARVFFPRARQSRKTVQRKLRDRIVVLDAVCYDNIPVPVTAPILADVYVFTSPLNVAAYLDHQALHAGAKVVAIGPTTGGALSARGVSHAVLSEPTEAALVAYLAAL